MPKMDSILVHNPSSSQSLHLNSISGDSPVFHAAFFKSKVSESGLVKVGLVIHRGEGADSLCPLVIMLGLSFLTFNLLLFWMLCLLPQ